MIIKIVHAISILKKYNNKVETNMIVKIVRFEQYRPILEIVSD